MTVNITLFFQMIYFFISFYMLKFYIFIPALKMLNQQEDADNKLKKSIDDIEQKIELKKEQSRTGWLQMKETLLSLIPSRRQAAPQIAVKDEKVKTSSMLSEKERHAMKKRLYDLLSDR